MIKILIIRLSSLGDIVHTFPMIYDIKKNIKDCHIDWLVDESFVDLVKLNTNVDNIITVPLRKWKKQKLTAIFEIFRWYRLLNKKEYDYIIDIQGLIKSAIFTKFFKGDVYGFDKNSIKEKLATIFYKYTFNIKSKICLAITKNRLLSAQIFSYEFDDKKVDFGLNLPFNISDKKYIIFFHATSKDSKKYGINNWVTLADYLIKVYDLTIILPYGNSYEYEEALQIKNQTNSKNIELCERILDYNELVQLILGAEFVFGVDTGLVHLSNALNQKTIAIYTDTDPQKTGILNSKNSKNIGNSSTIPFVTNVIDLFETIYK
jgi:heptosyltransferase-1